MNLLNWFRQKQASLWLSLFALIVVGGRRAWVVVCQPPHFIAIAEEIGSIAQVRKDLLPNHSGTRLIFTEEIEKGLAVYCYNADNGRIKLLFERPDKPDGWRTKALDWSPNGTLIACVMEANDPRQDIVIFNEASGVPIGRIPAPHFYSDSALAWLSPNSLAYSTTNSLIVITQQPSGMWQESRVCHVVMNPDYRSLTATSSNSVAWKEGNDIWTYDLLSSVLRKTGIIITNTLDRISYSPARGEYFISCSDETGRFWFHCSPPINKSPTELSNEPRSNEVELVKEQGQFCFHTRTTPDAKVVRRVWPGMIDKCELGGTRLFFNGNLDNEPTGIWQYDFSSGTMHRVDSGLKHPFEYASIVTPMTELGTNSEGKSFYYHIWQPLRGSSNGKHPLILGESLHMWAGYPQAAANGEYYFAIADRTFWYGALDEWPIEVMALYKILAQRPDIDTNRVYLYGGCAESTYVSRLLEENPGLFKGAILFSADALPRLANLRSSRIFALTEIDDANRVQRLAEYQDQGARNGIPVEVVVQNGRHVANSIACERERVRQFARFLLED